MCIFKLLVVEDSEEDLDACRSTIKRYQEEKGRQIVYTECRTLKEAEDKLDSSYDGTIIDLKLADQGDEGNKIIKQIQEKYRIPIAVLTGTPDNVDHDIIYIGTYKKGETGYDKIMDELFKVYDTGLTKIMGGRGKIEDTMQNIFWKNIVPQIDSWILHVNKEKETEKALLRFTINHLMELLDDDSDYSFPEEMYISPPVSKGIKTGSIVKKKEDGKYFIVLSPACDLVLRSNGNRKTDKILLCEIESFTSVQDIVLNGVKAPKKGKILAELLKNNLDYCHHWLPKASGFDGGFINFRWVYTLAESDIKEHIETPTHQVSSSFVKDIISRFSAYYARQGQPDFEFQEIASDLLSKTI